MSDGIIGEPADELRLAFQALDDDEAGFALHCGRAGGMAAASGTFGIRALELSDDISDAYEKGDWAFLRYILSELEERPDNGDEARHPRTREAGMDWDVYGSVLDDALSSLDGDDPLRHSLMIGFVSGLMFRNPGSEYRSSEVVRGIAEDV